MKQGSASRDVREGGHYDPNVKVVNVRAVSQIGSSMGNHVTESGGKLSHVSEKLYPGKQGFLSPPMKKREFDCGSQGSY